VHKHFPSLTDSKFGVTLGVADIITFDRFFCDHPFLCGSKIVNYLNFEANLLYREVHHVTSYNPDIKLSNIVLSGASMSTNLSKIPLPKDYN